MPDLDKRPFRSLYATLALVVATCLSVRTAPVGRALVLSAEYLAGPGVAILAVVVCFSPLTQPHSYGLTSQLAYDGG